MVSVQSLTGQLVDSFETAGSADEVVTSSGDFLLAHAVADDENNVFCVSVSASLTLHTVLRAIARLQSNNVAIGVECSALFWFVGLMRRGGVGDTCRHAQGCQNQSQSTGSTRQTHAPITT